MIEFGLEKRETRATREPGAPTQREIPMKTADEVRQHLIACGAQHSREHADVFTDGACEPNPGQGGWAFIIRMAGCPDIELFGGALETTNNRMEMTAVLQAIRAIPQGISATIHSDSAYVIKGITEWMHGWQKNGWIRKPGKFGKGGGEVANLDLWKEMFEARHGRSLKFVWIKGHAGHEHNERADELAELGRQSASLKVA